MAVRDGWGSRCGRSVTIDQGCGPAGSFVFFEVDRMLMNRNLAPLITWLPSRSGLSLNGTWQSIIDVYDVGVTGPFGSDDGETAGNPMWGFAFDRGRNSSGRRSEYDFDGSPEMEIPGDWNTQHERFHFYEGSMWFRRRFGTPELADGRRSFVHFGAVNHSATVFLNGRRLAEHEGGFGPFCVEVTESLDRDGGDNALIVRVNNRREPDGIPTTRTDWFNYGGITRDVTLLDVPSTFVRDAFVQLDPADPTIIVKNSRLALSNPSKTLAKATSVASLRPLLFC